MAPLAPSSVVGCAPCGGVLTGAGAAIKDEEKDKLAWKEYLQNVMKKRGSRWLGLYKECQDLL